MPLKTIGGEVEKLVELRDVDIYQGDKRILDKVNLTLIQGEFCYLTGEMGSGKSSLLKTIYGDLPLRSGSAKVLDQDLSELNYRNKHLFRRKLGMIFQEYFLFKAWTVFENLDYILRALGWHNKDTRTERIKEVLIDVGLVKKIYDKTFELSGGEQQRLAIARAIINNPSVLIADEPTGNLDVKSSDELMYIIKAVSKKHKSAVLFATHDERLVKKFPARTYLCRDGLLQELN
jgi:cell division transport system ATP-binding protein